MVANEGGHQSHRPWLSVVDELLSGFALAHVEGSATVVGYAR